MSSRSATLLYPSEDSCVIVRSEHHVSRRRFLGRTYPKDVTLLPVAVEARLALNQLLQVSHMLCAIQPAFLLRYTERLTRPVASACARFILEGTKACYHLHIMAFCGLQMGNPTCHQMCFAD